MNQSKFLPSFVKQRGRGHSSIHKKFLKEEFLPSLIFSSNLYGKLPKFIVEIGSGNGDTAINFAINNADTLYVACEVFPEGIIQTAGKIYKNNLSNVYIFNQDARILLEELPNSSIDQVFLFFPDPWPKKKHHKRRILNLQFLELIKQKLVINGLLLMITDHPSYMEQVEEVGNLQNLLKFTISTDFPDWWVQTKYQKKAINEGRSSKVYHFLNQG